MSQGAYWVYLMASGRNGTLYAGITNDLARRVWQHKTGAGSAFVAKYGVTTLVWYESYQSVNEAIYREKQIKRWERRWKLELIEQINPGWKDLYRELNS